MKLTLNGKEFSPGERDTMQKRAKDYLNGLPLGSLVTAHKIAEEIKYSLDSLVNRMSVGFADYRFRDGARYLYGSPKTIKALNGKH